MGHPRPKANFKGVWWGAAGVAWPSHIIMRFRHVMRVAPPNVRAESHAKRATLKPKPTRGGDLDICTQPTPHTPVL
ncbi:hypothetical protein Hanom_Chr16g01512421 [Helianthus anomalus]